ncbi:hypothetical protein CRM22_005724, partial [Opisthorchis felineus]
MYDACRFTTVRISICVTVKQLNKGLFYLAWNEPVVSAVSYSYRMSPPCPFNCT